jgi:DNA-directed RNA polymerase subunit RPC12/RpoP
MFNLKKYSQIKKMNNFIFSCIECGKKYSYQSADNDCPNCHHHMFKLSFRGNFPKINDPDDPYRKKQPGDGTGWDGQMRAGDEDMSGFGTRFRGQDMPTDFSAKERSGDDTFKKDLPYSEHAFLGEDSLQGGTGLTENARGEQPLGEGPGEAFFDDESSLSRSNRLSDNNEAIGPHNMQTFKNVNKQRFKTVWDKVREAY